MKKHFVIFMLIFALFVNTGILSAYADDDAPKLEEEALAAEQQAEAQTQQQSNSDPLAGDDTIEEHIKNGWSSEFAESKDDTSKASPYESEIQLVLKLKIMSNVEKDKFQGEDVLSYVDYAKIIYALKKLDNSEIEDLKDTAMNRTITVKQAVKAMVSILGYDHIAGQETDYMTIAGQEKLLSGLSLDEKKPITREQMAKLIANSLEVDMMVQTGFGSDYKYEIMKGQTLLSKMDIIKIKGWVNATYETNIYGSAYPLKDQIQIDRVPYFIGETQAKSYLGNYVTAYANKDSDNLTIIKLDIDEDRNNRITVDTDDIQQINTEFLKYYTYDENGVQSKNSKKENFASDAIVVHNGRYKGTLRTVPASDLYPATGNISVIDTDFDGLYDVIMTESYNIYVVDRATEKKVVTKDVYGILDLSDDEKKVNIIMNGAAVGLSQLAEWNILSVAISEDHSLYTVYVSDKSIAGTVDSISDDKIILDDNKEYKLDPSFAYPIEVGSSYSFYLTKDDKIAAASINKISSNSMTGTGRNYAYLKTCYVLKGLGDKAKFRLFKIVGTEGQWVTLEGTDKMTLIDGVSMPDDGRTGVPIDQQRLTPRQIAEHPSIKDKPQLIVYETDITGKLSAITTAKSVEKSGVVDDDVFTYNGSMTSVRTYYGGYFGGVYQKGNCKLVRIPSDRTQEKLYGFEAIPTDGTISRTIEIYDADSSLCINGIILEYVDVGSRAIAKGYKSFVVNNVWKALDNDGAEIYKISDFKGNEYFVEDGNEDIGIPSVIAANVGGDYGITKASQLRQGDAIVANVDSRKYITLFRLDCRVTDLSGKDYFSYGGTALSELSYDYGVVIKNSKASNIVINTVGQGKDSSNNKPRIVKDSLLLYNKKTNKVTLMDSRNSILPGDVIFTKATYYYTNTYSVVIRQ